MRKILVMLVAAVLFSSAAFAGGIMTNTNQSAAYVRMLARDASLGIDAVYFNPAGLTGFNNGFYISLNNQTVMQNRTITNKNPLLNSAEYKGKVMAPIFPSIYAVYKHERLAFSFGFNPVGGGGGAKYEDGLPSFESQVASIVPLMELFGVTGYSSDIYFEGSSVFFAGQLGVSYAITDMISVFGGGRYVIANNTYNGYLKDIQVNTPLGMMKPGTYLRTILPGLPAAQQPIVSATADILDQQTADKEVDATQKGGGFTPVLGLSFKPGDRFNVGIKYEFNTKLEVENQTVTDDTGMFPDGKKTRSDMPAMLSVGAGFKATNELNLSAGVHYYFDKAKAANYGRGVPNKDIIDKNYIEFAFGAEYNITPELLVSLGYLRTQTGVNESYQNDLNHSLNTNSIGLGGSYSITRNLDLNLGFLYTMYEGDEVTIDYGEGSYKESYGRTNMVFAIGLDLKIPVR